MTFQEKLVVLRKIKGLTQDDFASVVGVSRQAVYKWESGQSYPEVKKLLEIKKLFDISIDNLLDEDYVIALPEKKRRRKMNKDLKEEIEAIVKSEEKGDAPRNTLDDLLSKLKGEAPKAEEAAPKAEEAPKAEPAPAQEAAPKAPKAPKAAPAPKAEAPKKAATILLADDIEEDAAPAPAAPKVEEAPKAAPAPAQEAAPEENVEEPAKKKGLFGRLFGR